MQFTYNLVDREAEQRLLPLARDRGMAVLVNRPFQEGALLRRLQRHPLPAWASEIGCRQLGAGRAQVHRLAPGRDLRDPGDEPGRPRAREHGRRARPAARRRHAPTHGRARGGALTAPMRPFMSEWWTYRISDFLMFAPATYWRLVELHNTQHGPGPWLPPARGSRWPRALARPAA